MSDFKIFKETAVPSELVPNSMIVVAPPEKPGRIEIYVVDNAGVATRKVLDEAQVQTMIDAAVIGAGQGLQMVSTIAQRDEIDAVDGYEVLVADASADPTVNVGWARYVWYSGGWVKLAEAESQDLILSWELLTGKPSSTPAQIDDAVSKRHAHANKTQLDKIGEDVTGAFTYNGSRPMTIWSNVAW